jgi:hypothetical protein
MTGESACQGHSVISRKLLFNSVWPDFSSPEESSTKIGTKWRCYRSLCRRLPALDRTTCLLRCSQNRESRDTPVAAQEKSRFCLHITGRSTSRRVCTSTNSPSGPSESMAAGMSKRIGRLRRNPQRKKRSSNARPYKGGRQNSLVGGCYNLCLPL